MKVHIEQFKINGASVAIYPMNSVRSVIALAGFRGGAWYEKPDQLGSTHFMEHMFFEGVEGMPTRELIEEYNEQYGIYANAFTGRRRMVFETRFPDENIRFGLGLLNKYINQPLFPQMHLPKEKNVVRQEWQDQISRPEYRFGRKIDEMLHGKGHVFNRVPIGEMDDVDKLTRDDLMAIYKKMIVPANAFVSIAGNVKVSEVKAILTEMFGSKKGKEMVTQFSTIEPGEKKLVHIEPKTDAAKMQWFWATPGEETYDIQSRIKFSLAMYLLGGSAHSMLFNRLREELGIAYRVGAGWPTGPQVGHLEVWTSIDPKNIELADKEVRETIKKFIDKPILEQEFQRAKDYLNWQSLMSYDSVGHIADGLFDMMVFEDRIYTPDEFITMRNKVTEKELREAVAEATTGKEPFVAIMKQA